MKIFLVATPIENVTNVSGSYPLGIAYIGTVLEKKGYEVKVFDFFFDKWDNVKPSIEQKIREEKPDIVGLSLMTTNRTTSFELAKSIKNIDPNIKIIMGGVHPTLMYEQILRNLPVDFVVLGEGEETTEELIDAIKKKKKRDYFKKIKGIAYLEDNEVIRTENRPLLRDLDVLPIPNHLYFKDKILKNKTFYLTTSRGCPFACTFCSSSVHWGRMRRARSPKKVIEELNFLKENFPDIKRAVFNDDEFIIDNKWVLEFCKQYQKSGLDIKWSCAARVTSLTEEVVSELVKSNCDAISLGLESGSPKMIQFINKCITQEQVLEAFSVCKKYNLPTFIFLMVGLPGESSQTVNETINFIKKLNLDFLYLPSVYHVFPGTKVYEIAKQQKFINDDYWLSDKIAPFYTYEHSKIRLIYWSFKIAFFYNLHNKKLFSFLKNMFVANLRISQIRRVIKRYFIN